MFTKKSIAAIAASSFCLSFSSLALADDDGERGYGSRGKREIKEEFWDGPCKVERELKRNGDYKEERKCQGSADHFRERKTEFWEGRCRIEREWKKNGDYKEERKCKGGHRHERREAVVVVPAPVVAYPPWIVVEGRAPVYRPGYEPPPVQEVPSASHCNSDTVGRILGGIVGAAVGNQIGSGSGRAVATAGGAIAGVLIGGEIGRRIDSNDQACIGQALEVAPVGHRVTWTGHGSQQYAVVPGKPVRQGDGRYCRNYVAEVRTPSGWQKQPAVACRRADGVWVATR